MTEAFLSLQTADMLRLLGGLGLAIQLLAHARAALRPEARACNTHFAMSAVAGLLVFPATWALITPALALLPAAWVAVSLLAMALRHRRRVPAKPRPAEMPWAALARETTQPPQRLPRAAPRNSQGPSGIAA